VTVTNSTNIDKTTTTPSRNPLSTKRTPHSKTYTLSRFNYFYPHSEWTLLECSTETIEDIYMNSFVFNLTIKRRALYFGVMVIAPTVLFALLNPLVFLLPVESGERVSLAMWCSFCA
jgi:hypothetical protein